MDRGSYDSANAPLRNYQYQQTHNNPYPQGDPKFNDSAYYTPQRKKGVSPWIKFGIPILIVIVAAAVVGGILGARAANNNKNKKGGSSDPSNPPSESDAISAKQELGVFATATNSWNLPVYPQTTNAAAFSTPTVLANPPVAWPAETFAPATPDAHTMRPDRPRLIAPKYKWDALPDMIQQDAYMKKWNATIFSNCTTWRDMSTVTYVPDGGLTGSGILDVSRQIKERVKAWAYCWRLTQDQSYVERTWEELFAASGNSSESFGTPGDPWNSLHFLDLGEMTAAYAFAYDWMYDAWTPDRRQALMWSIITDGLQYGMASYNGNPTFGWWTGAAITGNWNCVCNGGMLMGALAIHGDDPTGISDQVIDKAIDNVKPACAHTPSTDGTSTETANYWYFAMTGYSEFVSSLLTATGSDFGVLGANPNINLTGLYHIYSQGATSLFNHGDHGPNKYSTNANSLLFFGDTFQQPLYTLYQRDASDSAEPTGMFWYQPQHAGGWWADLPLDHYFADPETQWATMRSTFTDGNAMYIAMKAGKSLNHQTHDDLDQGDFVFDAMGERYAGEYGSDNYLNPGYFSSELQDSVRWMLYRKMTEGQNTLLIGKINQNVDAAPTGRFESTGETQSAGTTVYKPPQTSTAYFIADLTSCYNNTPSVKRGIRTLNGRRQMLLQDEINTGSDVQWRVQTNASVAISGNTATLTLEGKDVTVTLLDPPPGAAWSTQQPVPLPNDPPLPDGDVNVPNPGVTVLSIVMEQPGTYTLTTLWNPQWPGMKQSDFVTPPVVALDNWSLTSHT